MVILQLFSKNLSLHLNALLFSFFNEFRLCITMSMVTITLTTTHNLASSFHSLSVVINIWIRCLIAGFAGTFTQFNIHVNSYVPPFQILAI